MHFGTDNGVALGLPLIAIGTFPLVANWNINISESRSLFL